MKMSLPAAQRPLFERLVGMTVEVRKLTASGRGAGVVLTADGLIVTAWHVVTTSRAVRVRRLRLDKKRWRVLVYGTYKADVIFRDKKRDIAVIRLRTPPANLPFAELGNSDTLKVGEPMYRVGRDPVPLANGRLLRLPAGNDSTLHVSMGARPGASGGPIFDELCKLLGVCLFYQNQEILPPIAYAIPVATLRKRILRRKPVRAVLSAADAKRLL